jgi:hypothetical protein
MAKFTENSWVAFSYSIVNQPVVINLFVYGCDSNVTIMLPFCGELARLNTSTGIVHVLIMIKLFLIIVYPCVKHSFYATNTNSG